MPKKETPRERIERIEKKTNAKPGPRRKNLIAEAIAKNGMANLVANTHRGNKESSDKLIAFGASPDCMSDRTRTIDKEMKAFSNAYNKFQQEKSPRFKLKVLIPELENRIKNNSHQKMVNILKVEMAKQLVDDLKEERSYYKAKGMLDLLKDFKKSYFTEEMFNSLEEQMPILTARVILLKKSRKT